MAEAGATLPRTGIIAAMTERGLPGTEGSPACPFVAFDDDREARADQPDHRHRCFADDQPAPRALAHQEAYCLSSAFPVCPTFQAWARREAAQARTDREAPADAPAVGTDAAAPAVAAAGAASAAGGAKDLPAGGAEEWIAPPRSDDIPVELTPHRNPPRDWAAPPPWASDARTPSGTSGEGAGGGPPSTSPGSTSSRSSEGQGLAGSAADRLAGGGSLSDPAQPAGASGTWSSDEPSSPADPELAGLVGGAAAAGATARAAGDRSPTAYPPSTRSGRRPAVSSTRTGEPSPPVTPRREPVQHDGPTWERARRSEAYPMIRARAGLGGIPSLPRVAVLAGALAIAAVALFFLPALFGIGGTDDAGPSPSPSAAVATATPEPTPVPEPTPQVYVIKTGDTLSKVAREFGVTLDQLLEANADTITNPDRIAVGDTIIIPLPPPEEVSGGDAESPAP